MLIKTEGVENGKMKYLKTSNGRYEGKKNKINDYIK